MQLPEAYFSRFREFFPELYPAYRDSLGQPPFRGLRANTLKITPAALAEKLKETVEITPVPFCPEGFYICLLYTSVKASRMVMVWPL